MKASKYTILALLVVAQQGVIIWLGYTNWTLLPGRNAARPPAERRAPPGEAGKAGGARLNMELFSGTFLRLDGAVLTLDTGEQRETLTLAPGTALPDSLREGIDPVEVVAFQSGQEPFVAVAVGHGVQQMTGVVTALTPDTLSLSYKLEEVTFALAGRPPVPAGVQVGARLRVVFVRGRGGAPLLLRAARP